MKKRNDTMESQVRKRIWLSLVEQVTPKFMTRAVFRHQLFIISLFCFLMAKMNRSIPHHDRRKACDVELSEPVYENVKVSVPRS